MAIYTPQEAADLVRPTNIGEAIDKGTINFLCKSAPYIAGYGLLTGNLPAVGFGAGAEVACNLPFIPMPDPPPPPYYLPQQGGCLPIRYNVRILVTTSSPDCSVNRRPNSYFNVLGPVGRAITPWGNRSFTCRQGQSFPGFNAFMSTPSGNIFQNVFFPDMGDVFSLEATPVSGSQNDSSCVQPVPPSLPPGLLPPPGFPDNPYLPGDTIYVPIYPSNSPTDPPERWVPIVFPPVVLPVFVAPSFPINAPINIPVTVPVSFNPNITGNLTVQIGTKGEIRTPPDLICPCEVGEPDPAPVTCPQTTKFSIPYYKCGSSPSFETATIDAIESSVPVDLFDKLLSSANLAEIGCESTNPNQVAPSLIFQGRSGDILVAPIYSPVLAQEIVSVELRITQYSEQQYRELTTFPGAKQIKFGSASYCLVGTDGGETPSYLWDEKTYIRLPKRLKPARMKILLREGISFELWDTGERDN